MTQHSKFLFNQEFFVDRTVSLEMLSIEKRQSYAEGFDAGRAKALQEIEQKVLMSCVQLQHVLSDISRQKQESCRYAVSIAEKVFLTLFPKYSREGAVQEVSAIVNQVIESLNEKNEIHIRCHPDVKAPLEERLKELRTSLPFVVEDDEGFIGSDIHIDWKTGFLFRSEADLALKVQSILETFKEKTHE